MRSSALTPAIPFSPHHTALYHTALNHTALYHTAPYHIALYHTALYHTTPHRTQPFEPGDRCTFRFPPKDHSCLEIVKAERFASGGPGTPEGGISGMGSGGDDINYAH